MTSTRKKRASEAAAAGSKDVISKSKLMENIIFESALLIFYQKIVFYSRAQKIRNYEEAI